MLTKYVGSKKNTVTNDNSIEYTSKNSPRSQEVTPKVSKTYDTLYSTVYNNALSDEELTNTLDKRVYDTHHLDEKGIEKDPSFKNAEKVFETTIDAFSNLYDFLDNYTN